MTLGGHFDITNKKARIKEIEDILNDESIWNDLEYASSLNQELSNLKKSTSKYNDLYETIKTNMLAIQGKAKMVAEEEKALKKELIGTKILIEQQDQKVKDFLKSQNIEIEEDSKYYILKKEDLSPCSTR